VTLLNRKKGETGKTKIYLIEKTISRLLDLAVTLSWRCFSAPLEDDFYAADGLVELLIVNPNQFVGIF